MTADTSRLRADKWGHRRRTLTTALRGDRDRPSEGAIEETSLPTRLDLTTRDFISRPRLLPARTILENDLSRDVSCLPAARTGSIGSLAKFRPCIALATRKPARFASLSFSL